MSDFNKILHLVIASCDAITRPIILKLVMQ